MADEPIIEMYEVWPGYFIPEEEVREKFRIIASNPFLPFSRSDFMPPEWLEELAEHERKHEEARRRFNIAADLTINEVLASFLQTLKE